MRASFFFFVTTITAAMVGCSDGDADAPVDRTCAADEKSTVCTTGEVTIECYQGATPQTNGTCKLILQIDAGPNDTTTSYTEDIYCCGDD